jgi:beta-N-acetylhexosaminidase
LNRRDVRVSRRAFTGVLATLATTGLPIQRSVSHAAQPAPEVDVEAVLARLSLAEKVAQLFIIDAPGTMMTPEYADRLSQLRPGGVILLGPNVGAPNEVAAFVTAIHATNPDLPPLVAVDEEGGPVTRLPADPAPGAVELGLLPTAKVQSLAHARAEYVATFGFDVNFAPVADVAYTADSVMAARSFGSDPAAVAAKVAAYVRGVAGAGVLHAAKHFPGHGRAALDSHVALPEIDLSLDDWRQTDGLPFRAAVAAGVPIVMLGHLLYPRWDDVPTSISPVAVDMLRRELGFAGLIVTDDLGMAALADLDPFAVVDRALSAGVDLLLFATHAADPADLIAHLQRRVEEGAVSEARLDESLRRLLRAKLAR